MALMRAGTRCTVWVEDEQPYILKGRLASYSFRTLGEGLRMSHDIDMRLAAESYAVGRATPAEQMALAVLAGDKVAALALADAIVNGEGGA